MGGKSNSSSSQSSTTNNIDKRLVVDGGVGVSSDSSTVHVTSTTLDAETVKAALDFARGANDAAAVNYDTLLSTTDTNLGRLFTLAGTALEGGFKSVGQTQQAMAAAIDTVNSKGTLDNRTITILGVAAAVAVGLYALKGKT